jgi:hypothetical protein
MATLFVYCSSSFVVAILSAPEPGLSTSYSPSEPRSIGRKERPQRSQQLLQLAGPRVIKIPIPLTGPRSGIGLPGVRSGGVVSGRLRRRIGHGGLSGPAVASTLSHPMRQLLLRRRADRRSAGRGAATTPRRGTSTGQFRSRQARGPFLVLLGASRSTTGPGPEAPAGRPAGMANAKEN